MDDPFTLVPSVPAMDLHHFFDGTMRREEVASAYLATLLDYNPAFRREFLRAALEEQDFDDSEHWIIEVEAAAIRLMIGEPKQGTVDDTIGRAPNSSVAVTVGQSEAAGSWRGRDTVDPAATDQAELAPDATTAGPIEMTVDASGGERLDVVMESAAILVIIENKLGSTSLRVLQLSDYYDRAVAARPEKRIVAVYVAPDDVGHSEVRTVKDGDTFRSRPGDRATHIGWETRMPTLLSNAGAGDWFAQSGMRAIKQTIEHRRDVLARGAFPVVGERVDIRRIVIEASDRLARRNPGIEFHLWKDRTTETIHAVGHPAAMWVRLIFEAGPEPDFAPIGVIHGDSVRLTVLSRFSLSQEISRTSELARRWRKLETIRSVVVPGAGRFARGGKWFERQVQWVGPIDAAPDYLANAGQRMIDFLRPHFWASDEKA